MSAEPPPPGDRMRRHLEGWQLGLLAVLLPALAVWLALPRPVAPADIPLPDVDRRRLDKTAELEAERVRRVQSRALPFSVRRVGELVRRFGTSSMDPRGGAPEVLAELRREFRLVRKASGAEALLALRALQTQLFVTAVRRWEAQDRPDRDFVELAGNFDKKCQSLGWIRDGQLVFSDAELSALYRVRWNDLTGASADTQFRPSLDEARVHYRALLLHPEGQNVMERDARRLAYVTALGKRDVEYPVELAQGVLLYRLGQPGPAAAALMDHLTLRPDGPYALRARNYLLAALAGTASAE